MRQEVQDGQDPAVVTGRRRQVQLREDAAHVLLADTVRVLDRAAATGHAEPTDALAATLAGQLTGAASARNSAATALLCGDAPTGRDIEAAWRTVQARRAVAPLFGPLTAAVTPCTFWPAPPARTDQVRSDVPALVVRATGDVGAVPEQGAAMHHALSRSRMVTLAGARDHGIYLFHGDACVDSAVNAYLATGDLPPRDLTCTEQRRQGS